MLHEQLYRDPVRFSLFFPISSLGKVMSYKSVPLYSTPGLLCEADEHLYEVFQDLGYDESFFQTDVKLFLGYFSVALVAGMYWAEKKYNNDFQDTDYIKITTICVIGYVVIQSLLYLYTKFVVENTKYTGYKKGKMIQVSTWTDDSNSDNSEPFYCIELNYDGYESGIQVKISELFFDDGYLNLEALKSKIATCIEAVDKSK